MATMRANNQPTWRDFAKPLLLAGNLLAMVPFLMLLIAPVPPEQVNRPFLWILLGVWMLASSVLFTWAMRPERQVPLPSPPPARRRARIIDLAARRQERDTVARRLARLRDAG
jgi:hypothetical protein